MYDYSSIYWLLCSCILVRGLYIVMHRYILSSNDKYNTLSNERQMYIQKNIVKSTYLAILTVYATIFIVWPIYSFGFWDNYMIHRLAALYVSNDIVGLICVDNLPKSTRNNHTRVYIVRNGFPNL